MDAMTVSTHEVTRVAPVPTLVTVQPTVTSAGSPIVWASTVTAETARSGSAGNVRLIAALTARLLASLNSICSRNVSVSARMK